MNANEVIANRALELLGHAKGDYQLPASQRTRQHEPEHQRRLSDRAEARGLFRHHAAGRRHGACCAGPSRRKAEEFKDVIKMGRTQLQDAVPMTLGPGILHLCGDAGRGRAAPEGSGAADLRDQHGRHRHRHRHQRASGLCRAGLPASARGHRHSGGHRVQPDRGDAGLRQPSCSSPAC